MAMNLADIRVVTREEGIGRHQVYVNAHDLLDWLDYHDDIAKLREYLSDEEGS